MLESFGIAFGAVFPFLVYLAIGYSMVRLGAADMPFMNRLNKMTFQVFFPSLMFQNIYSAKANDLPSPTLLALSLGGMLLLVILLMLIVPRLVKEPPRQGVIVQGIFRSNFVLYGVSLTTFVFGQAQSSVAGFMTLVMVSFFNITAIIVLEYFRGGSANPLKLIGKLFRNPLLQGCLAGLVFFLLKWDLPGFVKTPVSALASLATPLAMITLGGTLSFAALRRNVHLVWPVLLLRLIVMPLLMLTIGYLMGLRGVELFLLLMIYGTPVAASSYPMAMNMGGDGELAGQLVFVSTVLSLGTIFAFIFALSRLGLI